MEAIKFIYGTVFKNFGEDDQLIYKRSEKNWKRIEKILEDEWQDEDTVRTLVLIDGGKA